MGMRMEMIKGLAEAKIHVGDSAASRRGGELQDSGAEGRRSKPVGSLEEAKV